MQQGSLIVVVIVIVVVKTRYLPTPHSEITKAQSSSASTIAAQGPLINTPLLLMRHQH